ncbi:MAG: transcription elongation factor GreB [Tagaea sp.]|nr:transcription elongation factor GreB [Azospirillum sp.]MCA3268152.1 transcription elongation factor GreB [Azospirillum sp.]MCZ8122870.1 transcription elongation factor GreB [Magnetospirillum sp.]
MSKAFTKEDDRDDDDGPALPPLPGGSRNLITPAGWQALQDELKHLLRVERPKVVETVSWAAGNGDRSENGDYIYGKRRLREIDRRIRFLTKRLEIAQIVDPARQTNRDQVFFGARVTYADGDGAERVVRIVGVDETGRGADHIAWVAPVARSILKARVGDLVDVRTPKGVEQLEILKIEYPDA